MRDRYAGYTYAYPHKTAYRAFAKAIALRDLWRDERRDALFLYLHVPFCEMRCGFCNLFTTANPGGDLETRYLDAIERQARATAAAIAPARFARMAIGGGTPTFLSEEGLRRLFAVATDVFDVDLASTPISVETSPATADAPHLRVLREHHVDRVSIGVQSFIDAEVHAVGRSQRRAVVESALDRIRESGTPRLNIDLMYGLPGQTAATWLDSLEAALRYRPEEVYLYPLYVRMRTGIGERVSPSDLRPELYRIGADFLRSAGYAQESMRMFRRMDRPLEDGVAYCCQSDGMIGIGCGARSYTRTVHYACEWAVAPAAVREIIDRYARTESFDAAAYGFMLDDDEQRRRWLLQSLLQADGVDVDAYRHRFASHVLEDFPSLRDEPLVRIGDARIALTDEGLAWSDAIGPMFYSDAVVRLMEGYALR